MNYYNANSTSTSLKIFKVTWNTNGKFFYCFCILVCVLKVMSRFDKLWNCFIYILILAGNFETFSFEGFMILFTFPRFYHCWLYYGLTSFSSFSILALNYEKNASFSISAGFDFGGKFWKTIASLQFKFNYGGKFRKKK